jgi:hypothetical protein
MPHLINGFGSAATGPSINWTPPYCNLTVFMVTDVHEAHPISTSLTFGESFLPLQHYFALTCQSATGIPIVTGKPYVVLTDKAWRKIAQFADSDVIVALP